MSRQRVVVVCPGRGSYDRSSLGSLRDRSAAAAAVIDACDRYRAARGKPTVSALDAADAYKSSLHVAGEHASLLTFACTMADLAELDRERYEVVGVAGNSMGWYTALAAAGALSLDHAIHLVDTMGSYQERNVIGGQVLYPITDEAWRVDPALVEAVEGAVTAIPTADWSIHLGGFAVLGADADDLKRLLATLPPVTRGERTFPVQLPLHSAFHTPLMEATSARARAELTGLRFRSPAVPLVDGRGAIFRPRSADPEALRDYTLGHQVVRPYDFTTSIVTALHHTAPDRVVALGPGNPLGGPIARILVADGWHGIRTKASFEQENRDHPMLLSFGVSLQRAALVPAQ
ncbi:MAG: ACP S-malonyltransferase [Myxococcota bacterium]